MSRERRFQQGSFENYYEGRNQLQDDPTARSGRRSDDDYEVRRKDATDVGGAFDPSRGVHKGKGPRDYQRRDERILEDINDRLCDNPYIDATEIDVSVAKGDVVLSGVVEDRASKRLAEDIVDSVSGVQNVANTLRVKMRGI